MKFICPKCSLPLAALEDGCAKCSRGHTFDRSKEGYYNLLLSNVARHGDNREMVLARRNFLDTGAYLPLAKRVAELAIQYFPKNDAVLDVGCGEGYYTDILERAAREENRGFELFGFDISKDAVRLAAKRNPRLSLTVASAYKMPFEDASFGGVLNLFSPLALSEIVRVLKPGGHFIMAIPGEEHLFRLKSAIYTTPYKNEVKDSALPALTLVSREKISYELSLVGREQISSLFMMTPYAYRTRQEDSERLLSLDKLTTEVEFILFVYKKD